MEAFWVILLGGLALRSFVARYQNNQRLEKLKQERLLEKSFLDKAEQEFPDLVGAYWNPKRNPVARDLRPKVLARTSGNCFYCDTSLTELFEWQVDHVWPYRYGGSEEFINLVPSCRECNESKWSHLPPRYLLYKWVLGRSFTKHEIKFLDYYRDNSMANLIGTSAYWKGRADHWHATIFPEFVDLILCNEGVKGATEKRQEELIKRAQHIYNKLDCDITKRSRSYTVIQDWLDSDKWWEDYLSKNQENES